MRLLPRFLRAWKLKSEAVPAGHGSEEERMPPGVASKIPECASDLAIRIYCRSGRRRHERWKLTSCTRKPKANDLGLWTTRPADNPKCRSERSRIQYEAGQLGRHPSSLPNLQPRQTREFGRDFDVR